MDIHSEARLAELHPVLAAKIRTLAATLLQESIEIRVTQGFRTWAVQHAIYLQGRADIIDVNACRANCGLPSIPEDQNHRVTDADAGYSWHCFGLAADVAPFKNGRPVWDETDPSWARIVSTGESLGLVSGISWRDEPHFEWTCQYGDTPTDSIRQLYQEANVNGSGSKAVWDSLIQTLTTLSA